ncbi:MAG: 4Fe-4S binding protein [Clostridia bacterium]|nr:4Fe-4S binding protein [Clostridia bacterium]
MKKIKLSLRFSPHLTEKPITYHLIKDYDLVINILNAEINFNKAGKLTVEMEGTEENIDKGLRYLEQQGVKYKIFTKTIIWEEDKCVHCGACTAVCPSRALKMDQKDWSLSFDKSKCLVCELCIQACPINAMDMDFFL